MNNPVRSLVTFVIMALVFWLIWSRLHFVVLVNMPWWGLFVLGLALFLALDWFVGRVIKR